MPDRTKRDIWLAFNRLIKTTDFDKVTVEQICREAEVGRTTFYRYFADKYEVMHYNYKFILDTYLSPAYINTLEDLYVYFLKASKPYWKPIISVFNQEGMDSLHRYIAEYSYDAMVKLFGEKKVALTKEDHIQMRLYTEGCAYFYDSFIHGKYGNMTPEEGAHAIYGLLPEKFQGYLWDHMTPEEIAEAKRKKKKLRTS